VVVEVAVVEVVVVVVVVVVEVVVVVVVVVVVLVVVEALEPYIRAFIHGLSVLLFSSKVFILL